MMRQPYAKYATAPDPWVGQYPSQWTYKRADFLITSPRVAISPTHMKGKAVFHYSIPNVQEFGTGALEEGDSIDSGKQLVRSPVLLVSKLNPYKITVCIAKPHPDVLTVASGEFIPIESDEINLRYALYVWSSEKLSKRLTGLTQSVTRSHQRVAPEEITRIPWAWPSSSEQSDIAAFLDRETARIDALVEKKRRLLELLKEKRLAVITHAVTKGLDPTTRVRNSGSEWLGEIPAHWDVKRLDHINDPMRPIMYGIVLPGPHIDGGVPIIKGGDVRPDRLNRATLNCTTVELDEQHARSRVAGGDLVYSIRGSFGEVEIVPDELEGANLTQDAARIAPVPSVVREWLLFALKSETTRQQLDARSLGATIKGVNIRDLKRVCLPVPPALEQEHIAAYLKDLTARLARLQDSVTAHIAKLTEFRSALITAAVTGKIDLRGAVEKEAAA